MVTKTHIERVQISRAEKRRLRRLADNIRYPANGSYEAYIATCRAAVAKALQPATVERLSVLLCPGTARGPVVLANLPYDASVTRGLRDPEVALAGKPCDLSEAILTGIVALIGEPYAILQEGKGLIAHLSPKATHLHTDTGIGAIRELSTHIENAAARLLAGDRAPDGLALIGVSKELDASPGTIVADGRLALGMLGDEHQSVLADPTRFGVRFPNRWREEGFTEALPTALVQEGSDGVSFIAALYGDLTVAYDAEAEAALQAFAAALRAVSVDLAIEPGTLALIDNHVIFHGRRGFMPAFDEDGLPYRLVQRLFWISSLDRFGEWSRTRGRLIAPKH